VQLLHPIDHLEVTVVKGEFSDEMLSAGLKIYTRRTSIQLREPEESYTDAGFPSSRVTVAEVPLIAVSDARTSNFHKKNLMKLAFTI